MPTTRLTARAYSKSDKYISVTGAENLYKNTDNTSSASVTTTYQYARYLWINKFDFSAIPSGATVNSFTVKIKGYATTKIKWDDSYAPCLVNGEAEISGAAASKYFGTTASTITIPTGSLSWDDIIAFGDDFGIRVALARESEYSSGTLYIYGAEIEVSYSDSPVYIKSNGVWVQSAAAYKKVTGSWVKKTTGIFDDGYKYRSPIMPSVTEMDYLQSDGSQFIDTGFVLKSSGASGTRAVITASISNSSSFTGLFGARAGIKNNAINIFNESGRIRGDFGTEQKYVSRSADAKVTIDFSNNSMTVGSNSASYTSQTITTPVNAYLFTVNTNGTAFSPCTTMKLYGCKLYDKNGSLIRDFQPVIDENGVACLLDKVSLALFYNIGTGDFVAGND